MIVLARSVPCEAYRAYVSGRAGSLPKQLAP